MEHSRTMGCVQEDELESLCGESVHEVVDSGMSRCLLLLDWTKSEYLVLDLIKLHKLEQQQTNISTTRRHLEPSQD